MITLSPSFRSRMLTGLIILFAATGVAFAQTQKLTFDELPPATPLNGLSFSGVTFTFTIGGVGSADATYNSLAGPLTASFLQFPVAEGNSAGTLILAFDTPTTILEFGIARSVPIALSPGAVVQLFDVNGNLLQTTNLGLTVPVAIAEAQFSYSGTPVRRAVLTFPDLSVPRWALDNLVYQSGSLTGPGIPFPAASQASDQKAGSILFYNYYTSNPGSPGSVNTRFSFTNTNEDLGAYIHLFFVDGATCSIADRFICLTKSQTMTFLASEQDPGTTGYLVAVAVSYRGCPINFNYLIGDEYVKLATGEFGTLAAESIAAIMAVPAICSDTSVTAALAFNGINYNLVPRVLSLSNISSRVDGVVTRVVVNRIGGSLATGAGAIGTIFGLLYNDQEQPHSFNIPASGCQRSGQLDDDFPRTTPRFRQVIPAGQSGWLKFWAVDDVGIFGAALASVANAQAAAGTFNGAHNLHKLRLTSAAVTIPVFPPGC